MAPTINRQSDNTNNNHIELPVFPAPVRGLLSQTQNNNNNEDDADEWKCSGDDEHDSVTGKSVQLESVKFIVPRVVGD